MVAARYEIVLILLALGLQAVYQLGYNYFVGLVDVADTLKLNISSTGVSAERESSANGASHWAGVLTTRDDRRDSKLGFLDHYEEAGKYAFRVGDILVHRGHGQFGVVLERFDVCQLSEEWHAANALPGMTQEQPFYTILVSVPGQGFTRHGAQSSHRR